jgi:hypothetical protein
MKMENMRDRPKWNACNMKRMIYGGSKKSDEREG